MKNNIKGIIQSSFAKGVAFSIGLVTTSLFAAALSMTIFSAGDPVSSSAINKNFEIAAPVGAVMAFYLASCPDGWAPADGTNGTPDLRGQFIRGRDNISAAGAAGNDSDRPIGDPQGDALQRHKHDDAGHNHASWTHQYTRADTINAGGFLGGTAPSNTGTGYASLGDPTDSGTGAGIPNLANETRPKNIALTYCMRQN